MSRKNNDSDAFANIFTIVLLGIFILLKNIIYLIIGAISLLIKFFSNKRKSEVKEKSNIIFNQDEDITKAEIKRRLGIFPKEIYENDFMPQVINRGENYYSQNKIYDYNNIENIHTCKVKGSNEYDVSIMFNENDANLIESMSCTCPHYMIQGHNCKHIYALLYKIKCEEDIKKIKKEINIYCNMIIDIVANTKKSLINNMWRYNKVVILNYNKYSLYIEEKIKKIKRNLEQYKIDGILLNDLFILIREYRQVKKLSNDVLNNIDIYTGEKYYNEQEKDIQEISELDLMKTVFDTDSKDEVENISGYTQEEIDAYALQDFEEDLVKQGLLDLESFKDKSCK